MDRMRRVEKASPHIMAVASGAQKMDLPPRPNAIGAKPKMVVREVSIMGRIRTWHARTMDR